MSVDASALNLLVHSLAKKSEKSWKVQITGFSGPDSVIERLQEIGLHHGTHVSFVGQAPFRGPLLFRMGATVVALREEEAQCLLIQAL